MSNKYSVVDLFCGAGGMSCGFEATGSFRAILGADHDSAAAATFIANHPGAAFIKGNICYVKGDDLCEAASVGREEVDVIIGGTPCQGFSTLGNRAVSDPRNLLFCEFARLVREVNPKVFVLENVSGMKTMKDLKDNIVFEMVNSAFRSIGYKVESFLLNAAHYGVPQERKRLLFVGHRFDDIHIMEPERTHFINGEPPKTLKEKRLEKALTIMDAISDLPEIGQGESASAYLAPRNEYQKRMRLCGTSEEVKELTMHFSGRYGKKLSLIMQSIPPGSGKTIWQLIEEAPHKVPKEAIPTSGFKNTYGRLVPNRPSMTITRNFGCVSSSRCIHPFQDRPLTPREAARIQSFRDDFVFLNEDIFEKNYIVERAARQDISHFADYTPDISPESEIYIYKNGAKAGLIVGLNSRTSSNNTHLLIGNAVPPLLAEAVGRVVADMLGQIQSKKDNKCLRPAKSGEPDRAGRRQARVQLTFGWEEE